MNSQQVSPQLQNVLNLLDKYGFKFFGYNEGNEPLVIAPNGQVITVNTAYNYVQSRMNAAATNTAGKGPEGMPQMPSMPQMVNVPDSQLDKKMEKEGNKFEAQKAPEKVQQNVVQPSVPVKAPVVAAAPAKISLPFGDGFTPKTFNPSDADQVNSFVSQNSTKPTTDPKKWLSVLLSKFLQENKGKTV